MRLQNYIIESRYKEAERGKEISQEQALKLVPKFSEAIKAYKKYKLVIIRFTRTQGLYRIVDPKKSLEPRKSANTYNYYTLLIDNSKKWSKYPKRSKSLICRVRFKKELKDYLILPENRAKIGQFEESDMWWSFKNVSYDSGYLENVMDDLNTLLKLPNYSVNIKELIELLKSGRVKQLAWDIEAQSDTIDLGNDNKSYDKDLSSFKTACKKFDLWLKYQNIDYKLFKVRFAGWLRNWEGEPIYDYLDKIFDPNKNNVKLTNVNNLEYNKEVWTDAECLLIRNYEVEEFMNKVKI